MSVKLVVADDHTLFRKGLVSILSQRPDIEVVGEAATGSEAETVVFQTKPDVVLLDLMMPDTNGFNTVAAIAEKNPRTRVIVISMYNSDSHIVQSIEAGACGYLDKNAEPEEIEMAIQSVCETGLYFNERTNKAMLQKLVARERLRPVFTNKKVSFNKSELDVIRCLARELTTTEIAKELFLSTRTIDNLRHTILQKTGLRNSVGIVLYAVRNNIIKL